MNADAGTEVPSFGFVAKMASGKTTYAACLKKVLEKEFGIEVYPTSFTKKGISLVKEIFGVDGDEKTIKTDYRYLLQGLFTKMREIDPAVWAKCLIREINEKHKIPFIVDNIRSKYEAEALKAAFKNFIIVRIETTEPERLAAWENNFGRRLTDKENNDLTETITEDVQADVVLFNNYSMEEMEKQVAEMAESIKRRVAQG